MIAGPGLGVSICDECVAVCNDIIVDDERQEKREQVEARAKAERWPHHPCLICGNTDSLDVQNPTRDHSGALTLRRLPHYRMREDLHQVVCGNCVRDIREGELTRTPQEE